jgi:hypothetical protein
MDSASSKESGVADGGAGALALKVGVEILNRVTPKGIAWVRAKLFGRDIIIVGQPRSGKTSFVRFFQYGIFTDKKVPRTLQDTATASFGVKMGRNESLTLQVRKVVDTVGQVTRERHAELISKKPPHLVVIFLDLSRDWSGTNEYAAEFYLRGFLENFAEYYGSNMELRRKLRGIILVLNKADEASSSKMASWENKCHGVLAKTLIPTYGPKARDIPVLSASLIDTYDAGRSADAVIQQIALSCARSAG